MIPTHPPGMAREPDEIGIRTQVYQGRFYVHWSLHLTTSFPIKPGIDGDYVVCADQDEAEHLRDRIAPGADLHPFGGTWDPTALALADVATTTPTGEQARHALPC